jgi:lipopolysaccharide transport system ATP-binding protein
MSFDPILRVHDLGKCYALYEKPADRLKQFLRWRNKTYYREFHALKGISFELGHGEVLGIIGRNGSGKSTLLQLLAGTLTPTSGTIERQGRIAALLELGSGFNPEFTGRENVYLSAAVMGLGKEDIESRYEEIVAFSGIAPFIDQPVKTYSSGMMVRLAFSVATSVDPDILIIDEALSVGDGEFSRRSFDRIMTFKDQGKTILFCSHALYQVDALCNRVIWLADGVAQKMGDPKSVIAAYDAFLNGEITSSSPANTPSSTNFLPPKVTGTARILNVTLMTENDAQSPAKAISGKTPLMIDIVFRSDIKLPVPTIGICIVAANGVILSSTSTFMDHQPISLDPEGHGRARVTFPRFPLLKGRYTFDIYLMCEKGIFVYDAALRAGVVEVTQESLALGVVDIPRHWETF